MKKIWIVAMTMCILLTGCGSKKQIKKADWKTDNMLFIQEKIEKLFDMTKKQAKRKSCFS